MHYAEESQEWSSLRSSPVTDVLTILTLLGLNENMLTKIAYDIVLWDMINIEEFQAITQTINRLSSDSKYLKWEKKIYICGKNVIQRI